MPETVPPTVDQPTAAPTNKTLAFLGASVATGVVFKLLEHYQLMDWIGTDAGLLREFVFLGTSGLIGLVAAYLKRDRGNQTAAVETAKRGKRVAEAKVAELEQTASDKRAKQDAPRAGHDTARK